jgi:pSer/pThr/pTyr-binding forkhead associated (FHA) protein
MQDVVVEVESGDAAGRRVIGAAGQVVRIGRLDEAELTVPQDPLLSNLHFSLAWENNRWRLRDLNSRFGTLLNGTRVVEAEVADGDRVVAGKTTFVLRLRERGAARPVAADAAASPQTAPRTAAASPPTPATRAERLLQILGGQPEPLFALLDAARTPRILELLRDASEEQQSLYEGARGQTLASWAPYLVRVPAAGGLLEVLAREGWGKSWGVYLTCAQPFAEVRKHFRHFLLVRTPQGEEAYFRFYDPRVLRLYLPTCRPEEQRQFFGPVTRFLVEAEDPERLLSFAASESPDTPRQLSVAAGP